LRLDACNQQPRCRDNGGTHIDEGRSRAGRPIARCPGAILRRWSGSADGAFAGHAMQALDAVVVVASRVIVVAAAMIPFPIPPDIIVPKVIGDNDVSGPTMGGRTDNNHNLDAPRVEGSGVRVHLAVRPGPKWRKTKEGFVKTKKA